VKYKDIRCQIKSGDVLAWNHRSWKSWYDIKIQIVRILSRSEFIHTGTAWVIGDRIFVIESVIPHVRIVPLSNLLECYWIPMDLGDEWDSIEDYALRFIGKGPYSQTESILQMIKDDSPIENNKWFCSKLTNELLRKMGIKSCTHPVTPSALVDHLLNLGKPIYKIQKD
jgi:hypothetical protein